MTEHPTEPIDPIVVDDPAEPRTKTTETRQTLIVDLEQGTQAAVAAFLRFIAIALEERRQLRITVE